MKEELSDTEIINGLFSTPAKINQVLEFVYHKNKKQIVNMVLANSGNSEEAKDVLQDALIALYENIRSNRFKGESAISSYLFSISKFTWLNRLKKKGIEQKYIDQLEDRAGIISVEESIPIIETEKMTILNGILDKVGESCKKILIYALYYEYSMAEICKIMGYRNEQVARNKKFKCNKKLQDIIVGNKSVQHLLSELK